MWQQSWQSCKVRYLPFSSYLQAIGLCIMHSMLVCLNVYLSNPMWIPIFEYQWSKPLKTCSFVYDSFIKANMFFIFIGTTSYEWLFSVITFHFFILFWVTLFNYIYACPCIFSLFCGLTVHYKIDVLLYMQRVEWGWEQMTLSPWKILFSLYNIGMKS
mgnify:CR=1 FL=1